MRKHYSLPVVALLLTVFMLAIEPGSAQAFGIVPLRSPNEQVAGVFGSSVADLGDVNQDGFPDLVVGAPGESPGNSPDQAGRAYILSGRDRSQLFELASPNEENTGSATLGARMSSAARAGACSSS